MMSAIVRYTSVIAALLLPALALPPQKIDGYSSVTKARLQNPEPDNWLMYRGNYEGWGYSPLSQINTENVKNLAPVWCFSTGVVEGHESPPIVNDGFMFVSTPENQVLALDARQGDLLWRYKRELPDDLRQLHPTNRGVALYEDKVYLATLDSFVVALDARSGKVRWEKSVEDYRKGYYMTLAPLVVNGKVMVGVSGGEFGIRGFVQAFDAGNGKELWKTYSIPGPGEPGHETWPEGSWRTGGAPVWVTGTYDAKLNLTYWGTGNAAPWVGDARPGDNLYSNSVIALDADTGRLKGHHQYHWNDSWDWDEVSAPLLVDVKKEGRTLQALAHAGRNGYLWLLERGKEAISFVDARPYVRQNVFLGLDPKTGRPRYDTERKPGLSKTASFCPSHWGGKNWPPAAYSPQTRYLYIPANENLCAVFTGEKATHRSGQIFTGVKFSDVRITVHEGARHIGELQAWDLDRGEKVWTQTFKSHNWGPVLATAGGVVFMGGTNDRYFRAFDARTGKILWEQRTNSGVIGVPISYQVDGVQYVAVQSGWGVDAQRKQDMLNPLLGYTTHVPQGGVLWVFALK